LKYSPSSILFADHCVLLTFFVRKVGWWGEGEVNLIIVKNNQNKETRKGKFFLCYFLSLILFFVCV
jgi:hypothetical protein